MFDNELVLSQSHHCSEEFVVLDRFWVVSLVTPLMLQLLKIDQARKQIDNAGKHGFSPESSVGNVHVEDEALTFRHTDTLVDATDGLNAASEIAIGRTCTAEVGLLDIDVLP